MNRILRVVLDTSTLVSAALRKESIPHQALVHALGSCHVCVSADTLGELERVLRRRKFDRYLDRESRGAFVTLIRRHSRLFSAQDAVKIDVHPLCRDPKDNQFLSLALAVEADALVSSDEDLLVLNPWHGVPILTPGEFLARLKVSPH